jgi:membrane-bound serine protease (ClpP class)
MSGAIAVDRRKRAASVRSCRFWAVIAILGLGLAAIAAGPRAASDKFALVLDIAGPIGPAVSDYIVRGLKSAAERKAVLAIIRMDTPGGLDTSMREIIQAIVDSPVPVASYVRSGGRAASAGTYILYASHVAAMAPGTNLGAATPVQIGGDGGKKRRFPLPFGGAPEPEDKEEAKEGADAGDTKAKPVKPKPGMEQKILNDAVAYIRSLAQMRGRNVEWAEKAVTEAASLPAQEALAKGVIDIVADSIEDLMEKIDGREVEIRGNKIGLATAGLAVETQAPDWRSELLAVITNPSVAYILLMIGVYGLIFEFYSPGMIAPGVIGGICLLIGLYALQLLPVNYAGLALTVLGIALMVSEMFVPSVGALGIGGLAALVIGSIMLLDTDVPGYGVSWWLIGAIALVSGGTFLLVMTFFARSRRRAVVSGPEDMIGRLGRVVEWDGAEGRIRVHGEMWRARSDTAMAAGQDVHVNAIDGLTLVVESATQGEPT